MAADDLMGAIASGDLGRLATIPGIGKKTAERVVLELREKMRVLAAELPERPPPRSRPPSRRPRRRLRPGQPRLQGLAAERAVAEVRREKPDAAFNDLLRASLNRLSRA